MSKGIVWVLAASVATALLVGATAVWLTSDRRVIGFVTMEIGLITAGVVAYFGWRANLRHPMLAETQYRRLRPW